MTEPRRRLSIFDEINANWTSSLRPVDFLTEDSSWVLFNLLLSLITHPLLVKVASHRVFSKDVTIFINIKPTQFNKLTIVMYKRHESVFGLSFVIRQGLHETCASSSLRDKYS